MRHEILRPYGRQIKPAGLKHIGIGATLEQMTADQQKQTTNPKVPEPEASDGREGGPERLSQQHTGKLRDRIKGETEEHASPARLEDEGQSGG